MSQLSRIDRGAADMRQRLDAQAEQHRDGTIVVDRHDGRSAIRHASSDGYSLIEYANGGRDVVDDSYAPPAADPKLLKQAQAEQDRATTIRWLAEHRPQSLADDAPSADELETSAATKRAQAFDWLKTGMNRGLTERGDTADTGEPGTAPAPAITRDDTPTADTQRADRSDGDEF